MVLGWKRPFCASIPRDRHSKDTSSSAPLPSPKSGSKFGFFSNPSTPRMQSQPPESTSGLRCRTTATPPADSPKVHSRSPTFSHRSLPSSPRSPSAFSLLKSSLRLSKSRCGICAKTVKSGQGTAIFTAECSHSFHFPCVAAHVKKQGRLVCPICSSNWRELPVLSPLDDQIKTVEVDVEERTIRQVSPKPMAAVRVKSEADNNKQHRILKVYNDDEPLMSPTSGARFNPIPESDEENEEFQGFFYEKASPVMYMAATAKVCNDFEARLLPDAAVVSVGKGHETHAVVLRLRAPPASPMNSRRAPIDLVAVLDVGGKMTADSIQVMKRAMRLMVSSLSAADRLSIVAFSATSKRLFPLRRMTSSGRRSARRIVDAMVSLGGAASANDAVKKAAKVLDDRRERNSAASILLLSDRHYDKSVALSVYQTPQSPVVSSSKLFGTHEIPVYSVALNEATGFGSEDALTKCIGGLLNVVAHDLRIELGFAYGSAPAEIAAVYSNGERPACHGSGQIRLGDFYAEEERELLVELKVPSSAVGAHHAMSVRSVYKDPSTQELIHCQEQTLPVPRAQAVRSSPPNIRRLRSLFVSTRAVAESRRLAAERNDFSAAQRMLSSARALLLQSNAGEPDEFVRGLEAELSELHRTKQNQAQVAAQRRRRNEEQKAEPLTPTSAWRAAEMLAKVAMTRKSMNRVSDLHGFEDARF
ncbi:unnamed protein product [Cuscuta campestris]|uniref:RING-type domain-containing protein n=2 Tax=Cuscuta sect. Cleistogrammica TaxID=1824901 RepID=A0A484NEZ2_9ASTE|nr:hypothetical protein DM860_004918 [Cuscuta australis]VFQ99981.1 unnamed protein product [Cuscuta campestris]